MIIQLLGLLWGISIIYATIVAMVYKWEIVFLGKYDNKMESSVIMPEWEENECCL